ncbi:MAG TPA: prepilin-type N-terminal cleavage/methylation domain-containing protein, partial [Mycobacterium sp.]|uniref:PulJ/GspJ family protein n=1 Tax=Mycobacterium sp. TaxID=1785 RepID=UPI002D2642BA
TRGNVPKRQSSTGALRHPRPSRHDLGESGFTLLELVISVALLTVIVAAIGTAITTSLETQSTVTNRLFDSANANLTSAIYVRDVESAAFVTTTPTPSATPAPCGTGSGMNFELGLAWGTTVVSYEETAANSLVRQFCSVSGSVTTLLSTATVARGLSSAAGIQVTVAPTADATAASQNWVPSAGTGGVGQPPISSVTLGALEASSTFHFDLLATPRLSNSQSLGGPPGGNPAPPPLFLLGCNPQLRSCAGAPPPVDCSGSPSSLHVNGAAFLDSTTPSQLNNGTFTASQIYSAIPPPNTSTAITGGAFSPNPPTYLSPQPDPYSGLTPPMAGDPNTFVYSSTLSFSGGTTVLASGTYILENGLNVSGQATLSSAPGGVLLYISGGSVSITGQANVTLSPLTPGPYAPTAPDLGIWQAASDTNPLSLAGNGNGNIFSGAIYAPTAQVGSSGSGTFTVGSVVAESIGCSGNGTDTIG